MSYGLIALVILMFMVAIDFYWYYTGTGRHMEKELPDFCTVIKLDTKVEE